MPDPIRKRFSYGQLWPLRPACSQNRPGPYMPDPTFRIRFSSVFPKKAWIILCETDLGGLVRVWPNTSGLEANRCAGIIAPCFWQDANGPLPVFPTVRLGCVLAQTSHTVQNQPGSDLVLVDCVRFGPNGSGPEASRCARIIRPASCQCFPADPNRMRIRSGNFTGSLLLTFRVAHHLSLLPVMFQLVHFTSSVSVAGNVPLSYY